MLPNGSAIGLPERIMLLAVGTHDERAVASVDKETALSHLPTFPNEEPPEKEAEPKPGR